MAVEFTVSATFSVSKKLLYDTWLSSSGHGDMTNDQAEYSDMVGEKFLAYDGYIWGKNIELIPFDKIVQSWRTSDFSDDEEDSRLEISFFSEDEYTILTIFHSKLPPHGMTYNQGWIDNYFEPMTAYFNSL